MSTIGYTDSQDYQNFGMSSDSKGTDSQESQTFGISFLDNLRSSQKSQNLITFACRLSISDKKRKTKRSVGLTATDPSWPYVKETLGEI